MQPREALAEIARRCPAYSGDWTRSSTLSDFGGNADDYAREMAAMDAAEIGDIARAALASAPAAEPEPLTFREAVGGLVYTAHAVVQYPGSGAQRAALERYADRVAGMLADMATAPAAEPVAFIQPDHLQKAQRAPFLCRVEPAQRDDLVPIYTGPVSHPQAQVTEHNVEHHSDGPIRRFMLDAHIDGMDQFKEFVLASDHDELVHDLTTNCDPAGMVAENGMLREQTRQLVAMIERLKTELRPFLPPEQEDANG